MQIWARVPGKDLSLSDSSLAGGLPSGGSAPLCHGFGSCFSASVSVFRVGAAGSSELLSVLVYPLVGHWRRSGREEAQRRNGHRAALARRAREHSLKAYG